MNNGREILQTICGARLTSVQFVLDYLILGFDEKGALTTLVCPEIHGGNKVLSFGISGYRDALCDLITEVVDDVDVTEEETICITFGNEKRLLIPLRERTLPGERAIFTTPKRQFYTW